MTDADLTGRAARARIPSASAPIAELRSTLAPLWRPRPASLIHRAAAIE